MTDATPTPPPLKRYRVHITEKRFHHMDVLAPSEEIAEQIALESSAWWIDDNDGSSDVALTEDIPADDPHFYPDREVCAKCGRTLTEYEDKTCQSCS